MNRRIDAVDFACERGGVCRDAGMSALPDGGGSDAGRPDAGRPNPGPDPLSCRGARPITIGGRAVGPFDGESSGALFSCWGEAAPSMLFRLAVPSLAELELSTFGSDFDTLLAVYQDDCTTPGELACSDDVSGALASRVRLRDVPAGVYFLRLGAIGLTGAGRYELQARGVLADGESCDSQAPQYACAMGVCGGVPGAQSCGAPLDCRDSIDVDGDGAIDEDACVEAPALTCPDGSEVEVGTVINLEADAADPQGLTHAAWSVLDVPSSLYTPELDARSMTLKGPLPLAGDWAFRFVAADADFNGVACETRVTVPAGPGLRVEAIWRHEARVAVDLDLHVLDPTATAWFDPRLDCYGANCVDGLGWGATGATQDPLHSGDAFGASGPEAVRVVDPIRGGSDAYRLGVHYAFDGATSMPAEVVLRVYCDGELATTLGPVRLNRGLAQSPTNDFWKVADVVMNTTGCDVSTLSGAGGAPLIVSVEEASMGR